MGRRDEGRGTPCPQTGNCRHLSHLVADFLAVLNLDEALRMSPKLRHDLSDLTQERASEFFPVYLFWPILGITLAAHQMVLSKASEEGLSTDASIGRRDRLTQADLNLDPSSITPDR